MDTTDNGAGLVAQRPGVQVAGSGALGGFSGVTQGSLLQPRTADGRDLPPTSPEVAASIAAASAARSAEPAVLQVSEPVTQGGAPMSAPAPVPLVAVSEFDAFKTRMLADKDYAYLLLWRFEKVADLMGWPELWHLDPSGHRALN